MGFILTLKVEKSLIKLMAFIFSVQNVIGWKFLSMESLGIQVWVGCGTTHCAPYLQVLLTSAKIKNFHKKINH